MPVFRPPDPLSAAGRAPFAALRHAEAEFARPRPGLVAVVLVAAAVLAQTGNLAAQEQRTFRGCIVGRAAETLTLSLGGGEMITIGTAWLSADDISAPAVDCVTIKAIRQPNGTYMAESVEAGDEPNEVNSLTEETTNDREAQHKPDDDE